MIAHIPDARDLNRQPLSAFKPLFSTLPPPDVDTLAGVYETAFTGPEWLRLSAGASLALIGLGGWWGMHFTAEGGNNLVLRQRKIQRLFPFHTTLATSTIDGNAGRHRALYRRLPLPVAAYLRRSAADRAGAAAGYAADRSAGIAAHAITLPAGALGKRLGYVGQGIDTSAISVTQAREI